MNLQEMIRERDELNRRIEIEERAVRDACYKTAIRLHGITLEQVESANDHAQSFGTVWNFNKWCDNHSKKRFRAWNDLVYFAGSNFTETLCDIDMLKTKTTERIGKK